MRIAAAIWRPQSPTAQWPLTGHVTPTAPGQSLDRGARSVCIRPLHSLACTRDEAVGSRGDRTAPSPPAFAPCVRLRSPPADPPAQNLQDGEREPPLDLGGLFSANVWHTNRAERPKRTHPRNATSPHPQLPPLRPSPAPPPTDNRTHPPNRPNAPQETFTRPRTHPPATLQRSRRHLTPHRRFTLRRRRELNAVEPGALASCHELLEKPLRSVRRLGAGGAADPVELAEAERTDTGLAGASYADIARPQRPFALLNGCGVAVSGLVARRGGSWPVGDEGSRGRGVTPRGSGRSRCGRGCECQRPARLPSRRHRLGAWMIRRSAWRRVGSRFSTAS